MTFLLPDHRHHDFAAARLDIALQQKNLLPGAQHQRTFAERDGHRLPQQRGLQVRVAVAIMPGLLMAVVSTGRDEFVKYLWQIALQAGFELDGANGSRGAEIADIDDSGPNAGVADDPSHGGRKIMHLAVT